MQTLPFIPLLNGYSPVNDDDVIRTKLGNLPPQLRLDTRLPYNVGVTFELNGNDHDRLMAFWHEHKAHYFYADLIIEDDQLRQYVCLFDGSPTIDVRGGVKTLYPEGVNHGTNDTSRRQYKSDWQFIVMQPYRLDQDLAIIAEFEAKSDDPFADYEYVS